MPKRMKKNYINVFGIHQNIYDECAIWCDKRDSAENGTKKKFHFYSHIMWNANAYMWTHLYVFKCNMLDVISFFFSLSRIFVWLTSIQSQPSQFDKPTRESLLFETKQKKSEKKSAFYVFPADINRLFSFSLRQIHPYAIHNYTYRTKAKQNTQRSMYIYPSSFWYFLLCLDTIFEKEAKKNLNWFEELNLVHNLSRKCGLPTSNSLCFLFSFILFFIGI